MIEQINNEARQAILASIHQNLAASAPFDAIYREHQAHRKLRTTENSPLITQADLQDIPLLERFRENLISIGGYCTIVEDERAAAQEIQEIIEKTKAQRMALSDAPLIQNLSQSLKGETEFLTNAASSELFDCDAGITSAQWAIAETGTLVLESEKEFSRLTSLVPPVHICVIRAECFRRTMGEVLEILNQEGCEHLSRTITFITGPSRTSDIELTLAIGVHGPRELHVIIITGEKYD